MVGEGLLIKKSEAIKIVSDFFLREYQSIGFNVVSLGKVIVFRKILRSLFPLQQVNR